MREHRKLTYKRLDAALAWKRDNPGSYEAFLFALTERTREAVVVSHLRYQVGKFGFIAWRDYGYGSGAHTIYRLADKLGTPEAKKVAELVHKAKSMDIEAWVEGRGLTILEAEDSDLKQAFLDVEEAWADQVEAYLAKPYSEAP
jgi:hypothetical protein